MAGRPAGYMAGMEPPCRVRHCEGFRVLSEYGRVGEVVAVLIDLSRQELTGLLVRSGLFRTRLRSVPLTMVRSVDARRKEIVIDDPG